MQKTRANTESVLGLLQTMPDLRRLCIFNSFVQEFEYPIDARELLDTNVFVSQISEFPVRFGGLGLGSAGAVNVVLETPVLERLCDSCPHLQELSLDFLPDSTGVETLLRRLPGLRALHLQRSTVNRESLLLAPAGLQSLTLNTSTLRPGTLAL